MTTSEVTIPEVTTPKKAKCKVPKYDGSGGPEVLESWILDLETWFVYDVLGTNVTITEAQKVAFARMKLTGLAQRLVENRKDQIKTWDELKKELRLEFYPNSFKHNLDDPYTSYKEDLKTRWLRLSQLFNTPVKDYIYQFKRLRILLNKAPQAAAEDKLIAKFISGLQECLHQELKSLAEEGKIATIDEAYRQALLAEEKISCKSTSSRTNGSSTISVSTKF